MGRARLRGPEDDRALWVADCLGHEFQFLDNWSRCFDTRPHRPPCMRNKSTRPSASLFAFIPFLARLCSPIFRLGWFKGRSPLRGRGWEMATIARTNDTARGACLRSLWRRDRPINLPLVVVLSCTGCAFAEASERKDRRNGNRRKLRIVGQSRSRLEILSWVDGRFLVAF